eukprot:403356565
MKVDLQMEYLSSKTRVTIQKLSIYIFLTTSLIQIANASVFCEKENQYYDLQTQKCEYCAEGCAQCTSADSCLKCQNDELFVDSSDGNCKFCTPGQFYNQTSGTCENCKCYNSNENRCFTEDFCPVCPVGQYLNLDTFQCSSSCPVDQDMIVIENHTAVKDNVAYCRGEIIYVDPTSLSALELGTFKNPYKCSRKAIQELYNYLPGETKPYQILIKEGTFSVIRLFAAQNFIVGAFNLTISSKSFNTTYKIGQGLITQLEINNLYQKGDMMVLRSNRVTINYYGKAIRSPTPANIEITNSLLITDYLNEGIMLLSDCSLTTYSQTWGQVTVRNFTQKGQRFIVLQTPFFNIQTLFNVTVDNFTSRAFARQEDTSKNVLTIDSTSLCPIETDNITKNLIVKNLYISSDAHTMDSAVNYQIIFAQKSDLNKRPIICQYENITTADQLLYQRLPQDQQI